ncbi:MULTISPECIES: histidine phosphatase family protein [Fusobacterium]|jgi:broad specificity phosphatase PhoE|uniref:Histidine phosphatase family protein n=1 Tax=Fusobacterium varium ATCC 27725 TaxID=469618 RepID=A0ABM6U0Z5_FUSVA|nr:MULTISPECIES: histidine phosphatase family protein [Fusobacterium]AVQ29911.1 histidine phosphatase family protein [Fusobacterium varium ATCC 27725]EES65200.1 phosphoglycerate mutase family protein [Fusobacterium varium ATCC 27725]MCF0170646.1 histidine phosphatase family protein [Fusobacterium varium]MCF2672939.1 histidine phosphatase family protein [Fusobacterium varium]MCI6031934.1 histidine phosphatase family protein [Fusobacterium varium]
MEIYFIRHGETLWNTLKIFQGSSDSPLTELGISQAERLAEKLKDIEFTDFYSSPMGRTIQTTKIIMGNRKQEIKFIDEFKEISMGDIEGMPRAEFEEKYPKEFYDFFNNPVDYDPKIYHGENYYQVIERVKKGLDKLLSYLNNNDRVVVVTHGVTLKALFHIITKEKMELLGAAKVPQNTSVSIVKYENGKFDVEVFSDTSHLD